MNKYFIFNSQFDKNSKTYYYFILKTLKIKAIKEVEKSTFVNLILII